MSRIQFFQTIIGSVFAFFGYKRRPTEIKITELYDVAKANLAVQTYFEVPLKFEQNSNFMNCFIYSNEKE